MWKERGVTLTEIAAELALEVRTAPEKLDVEVSGGYASDLLSLVMARAQEGNVWVTLQSHLNIVAVATLLDLAGVIVTEGMTLDESIVEKANREGIPILTTELATFTVVGRLFQLGVPGVDSMNCQRA
jgi:predicted transcriptional regulator